MKRPRSKRPVKYGSGTFEQDFSKDQLAGVGMVALMFNHAERIIDGLFHSAVQLHTRFYPHVTSRINGIDGKIEIIHVGLRHMGFDAELRNEIQECLGKGAFGHAKSLRDAVVHARILDSELQIGETAPRQGKTYEILLKPAALWALAHYIASIGAEIASTGALVDSYLNLVRGHDGPDKEQLEAKFRECFAQRRSHRMYRLSLPQLPEFPEGPEETEPPGSEGGTPH